MQELDKKTFWQNSRLEARPWRDKGCLAVPNAGETV